MGDNDPMDVASASEKSPTKGKKSDQVAAVKV